MDHSLARHAISLRNKALRLDKARGAVADIAHRRTERGGEMAREGQVIEVVETVTKIKETTLRKGMALVKNGESAAT